jgi:hypothetical protein
MTDTEQLEHYIRESGYKRGYIAKQLGLSRGGFNNMVRGRTYFRAPQIATLCQLLNIPPDKRDAIFFAKSGG